MGRPASPARIACQEFTRAEIARVGAAGLDMKAMVARFAPMGATRSAVWAWVGEVKAELAAPPDEAAVAARAADVAGQDASMAAAVEHAAVLATLPTPETLDELVRQVEAAAEPVPAPPAPPPAPEPPPAPVIEAPAIEEVQTPLPPAPLPAIEETPKEPPAEQVQTAPVAAAAPAGLSMVPDAARGVLAQLQTIQDTCNKVLQASLAPDGRMRNARQAIQAVEALRRTLETALKLYEAINNVALVERFMQEMLAAVGKLHPDAAQACIAEMRQVQGRWRT